MYYEILVTKDGRYWFSTAERACQTKAKARKLYQELLERFKPEDGYEIQVTHWKVTGKDVTNSIVKKEED